MVFNLSRPVSPRFRFVHRQGRKAFGGEVVLPFLTFINGSKDGAVVGRGRIGHARRADNGATDTRAAREAAYKFVHAAGGDLPGYEEATRALFAGDLVGFNDRMADWPPDVRTYAMGLAQGLSTTP